MNLSEKSYEDMYDEMMDLFKKKELLQAKQLAMQLADSKLDQEKATNVAMILRLGETKAGKILTKMLENQYKVNDKVVRSLEKDGKTAEIDGVIVKDTDGSLKVRIIGGKNAPIGKKYSLSSEWKKKG